MEKWGYHFSYYSHCVCVGFTQGQLKVFDPQVIPAKWEFSSPVIVLPPFLKLNEQNVITIVNVSHFSQVEFLSWSCFWQITRTVFCFQEKSAKSVVQIDHGGEKTNKEIQGESLSSLQVHPVVYRRNPSDILSYKLSSTLCTYQNQGRKRYLNRFLSNFQVDGKLELDQSIPVRPDVFNVHIHIDKTVYRKSEIVNVRILPLTHSGTVYRGELTICLMVCELDLQLEQWSFPERERVCRISNNESPTSWWNWFHYIRTTWNPVSHFLRGLDCKGSASGDRRKESGW